MESRPSTFGTAPTLAVGVSGAGAAVAVTIAAAIRNRWVIDSVTFGYGAAQTAGLLTIAVTQNGTAVTLTYPLLALSSVEPAQLFFPEQQLWGDVNTAIVVTLPAGGGAVVGYLNVIYH
jgi:hypothetical protein